MLFAYLFDESTFKFVPFLALSAALAAYIGAIRMWYHKIRTDSIDKLCELHGKLKAEKTTEQFFFNRSISIFNARLKNSVWFLRGIAFVDFLIFATAVSFFTIIFRPYLFLNFFRNPNPITTHDFLMAIPIQAASITIFTLWLIHAYSSTTTWFLRYPFEAVEGQSSFNSVSPTSKIMAMTMIVGYVFFGFFLITPLLGFKSIAE